MHIWCKLRQQYRPFPDALRNGPIQIERGNSASRAGLVSKLLESYHPAVPMMTPARVAAMVRVGELLGSTAPAESSDSAASPKSIIFTTLSAVTIIW